MPTITETIQRSPTKINELFTKIGATTDTAVSTREKLFSELKTELELHARLEEEHLFPVLRKHKETKDLVPDAVNDNKRAQELVAELEQMPKEGDQFRNKVAELRKVFQQHMRDERKELLPAVRKALSDEEAQAVVKNIEADKAEVEAAKRAEADQRRAEARHEREEAARREAEAQAAERAAREPAMALARSAETGKRVMQAGADMARTNAQTAQEAVRTGFDLVAQTARGSMDQYAQLFGCSGERATQAVQQSTRNVQAMAECSNVLVHGLQDISREWLSFAQDQARRNLDGLNTIMRARTPQDLIAAHSTLMRQSVEDLLNRTGTIAQKSAKIVNEAVQTITTDAEKTASRAA